MTQVTQSEKLHPQVELHLSAAKKMYFENESKTEEDWNAIRPRVIRRLNYLYGIANHV